MKSFDKDMLKTTAYFSADFEDKYIEGVTAEELKSLVLKFSLKMHPLSTYPAATRTHEGVRLENGIYGHSRFCNTDFDDKLACLNLSGV